MKSTVLVTFTLASCFVLASECRSARADGNVTVITQNSSTVTTPNAGLFASGLITFGVPYVASVVVASESNRPSDEHLFVPVAGPWLDLVNRTDCGHPAEPTCSTEAGYKALLVVNGVLQAVGALEVVGAFLFPTTRVITGEQKTTVRIAPTAVGNRGMGIGAVGTF